MGAWGHKPFEDDTALDLIDEWVNSDKDALPVIQQAVKDALAAEYLEYDQGHAIAVAAAVIEFVFNSEGSERHETVDQVDGFDAWLDTLNKHELLQLVPSVIEGLDLLLGDTSELAELWAENETLYPSWRQILLDRKAFLAGLASKE